MRSERLCVIRLVMGDGTVHNFLFSLGLSRWDAYWAGGQRMLSVHISVTSNSYVNSVKYRAWWRNSKPLTGKSGLSQM